MRTQFSNPDSQTTDNYLMVCDTWREKFLAMDHEDLIRRFHLEQDEEALYITYYAEKYRLDRQCGMVTPVKDPDFLVSFNTAMAIYNLFYYAKPYARVKGEFVPFRLVKGASPFDPAFQRTILRPLARAFTGRVKELDSACRSLGGEPIRQGNVGYVIHAFDWMPVTLLFWDADDEFEAQANMLFDADITDFTHEECVCCVASDLVRRLAEEAGFTSISQCRNRHPCSLNKTTCS